MSCFSSSGRHRPGRVRAAAPILALAILAADLGAQGLTFQSCTGPLVTADSAWSLVHAELAPLRDSSSAPGSDTTLSAVQRDQLAYILQELRARFVAPRGLALSLWRPLDVDQFYPGEGGATPDLGSRTTFTLHRSGRISAIRRVRSSPSPALDSALADALVALGDAGVLGGILTTFGGAPPPGLDSLRLGLATSPHADTLVATAPLLRVLLPVFRFRPAIAKPGNPAPPYPRAGRQAGIASEVLLQFVVDTAGRADMSSVSLIRAEYREFVESVLKVLPQYRFEPATLNECPARMHVQMPFRFDIRR